MLLRWGRIRSNSIQRGQRPSKGWLRLALAPCARSLEPVERRMGSAALRAEPLLWPWSPYGSRDNAHGWGGRYGPYDDWSALWYPSRGWRGTSRSWGNP